MTVFSFKTLLAKFEGYWYGNMSYVVVCLLACNRNLQIILFHFFIFFLMNIKFFLLFIKNFYFILFLSICFLILLISWISSNWSVIKVCFSMINLLALILRVLLLYYFLLFLLLLLFYLFFTIWKMIDKSMVYIHRLSITFFIINFICILKSVLF